MNTVLRRLSRGILPLYGLYRYVRPHSVGFLGHFGHKLGIDFGHFGHTVNRVRFYTLVLNWVCFYKKLLFHHLLLRPTKPPS